MIQSLRLPNTKPPQCQYQCVLTQEYLLQPELLPGWASNESILGVQLLVQQHPNFFWCLLSTPSIELALLMVNSDAQNELTAYLSPIALFEEVIILGFLCSTLHHKHHSVIAQCTCNFDCISWVCSCTVVAAFVFEMQISLFLVHILLFSILIQFSTV